MIHPSAFLHALSHIDSATVRIGARTKVWQFSSVIRGTVLGEDCVVASNVTLDGPTIGDRCALSPGVDIGPGFIIESDVFIGPNVVLCNDAWPRAAKDGFDVNKLRNGFITVRVCHGASIGANAVVLPGVVIGADAMVAAGSVVTKNVPPGRVWRGHEIVPFEDATASEHIAHLRMRPCSTS